MDALMDEALVAEFVTESREHLDGIEPDLLGLEENHGAVNSEVVNRIFRAIHSIKGGAGFLAYDALKRLSHEMEGVLMRVRDGEIGFTPAMIDLQLRSVDKLRAMLDDLATSDSVSCAREIAELKAFMHDGPAAHETVVEDAASAGVEGCLNDFDWQSPPLAALLCKSSPVYLVEVHPQDDLARSGQNADEFLRNFRSLGVIGTPRGADVIETLMNAAAPFHVIFGTVLEDDLAAAAIDLPAERVTLLPAETLNTLKTGTPAPREEAQAIVAPTAQDQEEHTSEPAAQAKHNTRSESNETLRVRIELVSRLMNSAGELVLARNQLFKAMEAHAGENAQLAAVMKNMDRVTAEIQDAVMRTRLQPIGTVFGKFPRVVRDVARQLGKEIDVELDGTEVEVDRSVIELIGDPLTHIIRNCADHAVETPADRVGVGKPRRGRIDINACYEGGQVVVRVTDDGRGIDPEKIRKSALAKGVITEDQARRMGATDLVQLIFAPGFSTAEKVTDVSGRGVGMDVVRTNIEKLGGTVEVDSQIDKGTTVSLRIPLTLAIVPALLAGVEQVKFAIPQMNVEEIVWVKAAEACKYIERVQHREVLRLRDTLLPLVRLADVLGIQRTYIDPVTEESHDDRRLNLGDRRAASKKAHVEQRNSDRRTAWQTDYRVVVVRVGRIKCGLIVDRLFDSEDIVMKPLSAHLKACKCFSGATITGDGQVIAVLDVPGLAALAGLNTNGEKALEESAAAVQDSARATQSVVLFRYAKGETFAVAQQTLLRLEHIALDDIHNLGAAEALTYRGAPLPVVRLDRTIGAGAYPSGQRHGFLLIPKNANGKDAVPAGGVLVSEIVDTVELECNMHAAQLSGAGVLGSCVYNNEIVTVLDPALLVAGALNN